MNNFDEWLERMMLWYIGLAALAVTIAIIVIILGIAYGALMLLSYLLTWG